MQSVQIMALIGFVALTTAPLALIYYQVYIKDKKRQKKNEVKNHE